MTRHRRGRSPDRAKQVLRIVSTFLLLAAAGCNSGGSTAADHEHVPIPDVAQGDLAVAVPAFDLAVGGPQRFVVALFTADKTDIGYGSVELRFRWLGENAATPDADYGEPVQAEFRLLPGSATNGSAPDTPSVLEPGQGRGVYVTDATLDHPGFWQVEVSGDIAGLDADTGTGAFDVLPEHLLPEVGDVAIPSDNPTLDDTGVTLESLDSRAASGELPDPHLHNHTIAEAIADHRPAVVVFSTPTYCVSRFCGPVTEMIEDLATDYSDRADFIHIEIWQDFDAQQINPTAEEWLYRDDNLTEPWVFLIDADGRIAGRWDNVVIRDDLEAALRDLPANP